MCVLIRNLVFVVQSITPLCTGFWSPYLEQKGAEVRQSMADVTRNPCTDQFWLPSLLVSL